MPTETTPRRPSPEVLPSDAANLDISVQSAEGLGVTASTRMTGTHLNKFWEAATAIAAMAAIVIVPLLNAGSLTKLPVHLATILMVLQGAGIISLYRIWRSYNEK